MNLDEFSKSLRAFATALETQLPVIMSSLALDAKDMIEQRVTRTGINAQGNQFGDYVEGVYKQDKEDTGKQTAFVDFRNTGRMWNSITVIGNRISASLSVVTVGSSTAEEEDKLEFQEERYDAEVLELNLEEIAELEETAIAQIQILLDSFL